MENARKVIRENPRTKIKFILNNDSLKGKDLYNKVSAEFEKSLLKSYPTLGATSRKALSGEYAGECRNMFVPDTVLQPPYALIVEASVSYSYADGSVKISFAGYERLNKKSELHNIVAGIIKQYNGERIKEVPRESAVAETSAGGHPLAVSQESPYPVK